VVIVCKYILNVLGWLGDVGLALVTLYVRTKGMHAAVVLQEGDVLLPLIPFMYDTDSLSKWVSTSLTFRAKLHMPCLAYVYAGTRYSS